MITSPDSDMQQSITSNKNTFNHLQQPYISRNINIASCNSSDRHSVIYYNIHIRNNSPLHASSNETATQNRQCKQLSETTRTVFNTYIKVTLQTTLIGTHFIGVKPEEIRMEWHSVLLSAVGKSEGEQLGVKTDIWIIQARNILS